MSRRRHYPGVIAVLAFWAFAANAEDLASDTTFDVESFEKKPYEIGGYLETQWNHLNYNRDGALYRLSHQPKLDEERNDQLLGTLHLEGTVRAGIATLRAVGEVSGTWDGLDGDGYDASLFEGVLAVQPAPGITAEVGKKALSWGKGYAWNPVGFIQRNKDPDDPTASRKGYVMMTGDFITSLNGPVRTVAFTPVLVPVRGDINPDFGSKEGVNVGAKLYMLAWDTDVDLMFLTGASRTDRYGVDFSRNITSNFEVHGEWAYITDSPRTFVGLSGPNTRVIKDAQNWLLGLRYLTENDLTVIAEFYHQGTGFTAEQLSDFYGLANSAIDSGSASLLSRATAARDSGYGRPTPGRNYVYVRVSQQQPFDLLYWTPAATAIVNAGDGSFSVTPEIQYTGIDNLELRFRVGYLHGGRDEEYGEKPNDFKVELRARYHF